VLADPTSPGNALGTAAILSVGAGDAPFASSTGASSSSSDRLTLSADYVSTASGSHTARVDDDTANTADIDAVVDALLATSESARDEVAAFCRSYRRESDWFEREYRRVHIVHAGGK
jgi:hypothetical protein